MLMGFISLMLLACEDQITWFCIPNTVAEWITCDKYDESSTCTALDQTWVSGTPCCTLGDYYWSHLYESTIPLDSHRRMENISAEEAMLEGAHEIMGEAFSHRRLGAVNRHNSLLRTTCPSRKYTTDLDTYGEAVMPPAVHLFDCPANGHLVYLPPPEDGDYVPTRDPDTGFRSGFQGGSANEVGGFTSSSFMDPQALHHVHTLIFLTACFHVIFTVLVMVMAQSRIKLWQEWEFYGDAEDGSETVDKLRSPLPIGNPFLALAANFTHQFVKTVDAYTYIAIRRYYVVRNNLPWDFEFNNVLLDTQDQDFAELVGIEPWMWGVLMVQCILDGYTASTTTGIFLKTIGTWIAFSLVLTVGTKLVSVFRSVVYGVADVYDTERDGVIDQNDLDRLQGKDGEINPEELDAVVPEFWKDDPKLLLQLLRFAMFQFSVTLAECTFYIWQISHSCYFQSRGSFIWVVLIIVLGSLILLGFVIVPLYSLVSTTTHHDHDSKHPDKKPVKKKLATHKAVLKADMLLLKVALGLEKEKEADDGPSGEAGWKAQNRKKKTKIKVNSDPVKQAEIDAKKKIRGTFEWAIHMQQLEARIKISKEELQSAQRIKSQTKDEQKDAILTAKQAAKMKAAALKANQVAPSPGSSPQSSLSCSPTPPAETDSLTLSEPKGGNLPPLGDVEHGAADLAGDHGEHGHGHGEKCCGKEFPLPVFALSHMIAIGLSFLAFSSIQSWWHYAAESPGAHWAYEGGNGPEWWGAIKEKYAICNAGDNGTTWAMQSPIDINLNVWQQQAPNGASVATGYCSVRTAATKEACLALTPVGTGVWTSTGFNQNNNADVGTHLKMQLDPDFATSVVADRVGKAFNPTQSHKTARYDCGTQGYTANDGACGHLKWQAPGKCVEKAPRSSKHDTDGRKTNPPDADKCFQITTNVADCIAVTGSTAATPCEWIVGDTAAVQYNLKSFTFHSPSEHTVNGNHYAMEMQIEFCTGDCYVDKDMSYFAADDPEDTAKFAVYSVFFESGDATSDAAAAIDTIFEYKKRDCPQNRDKFGYVLNEDDDGGDGGWDKKVAIAEQKACAPTEKKLRLSQIVDLATANYPTAGERAVNSFYAYTGSLTSPPCTENIQWFVQSKVVTVGADTIKEHWKHIHGHPGNSRPVQPRNGEHAYTPPTQLNRLSSLLRATLLVAPSLALDGG